MEKSNAFDPAPAGETSSPKLEDAGIRRDEARTQTAEILRAKRVFMKDSF